VILNIYTKKIDTGNITPGRNTSYIAHLNIFI